MASAGAVREWCRATCACYPNVDVSNTTTAFRDGLAFCAIIHRHRPDLLEFSSLSKDNIYENNKLAFEVAETKLGIPALLDPRDMVSTKVPDCLSILTYLSQYYHFFNRKPYDDLCDVLDKFRPLEELALSGNSLFHTAGLPSLRSSHVTASNNHEISNTPEGAKPLKSSTDLETIRGDRLSNTRPRTVCKLCFKPIHLIQRHVIDGKIYHRSCFRCKVCHSTLLHGSYTQGSDAGSLICTHHITDSKITRVRLNQPTEPTENQSKCKIQGSYFSLGGLSISSIPHYTTKTESQDRLVYRTTTEEGKERQERSREVTEGENGRNTAGPKSTAKKAAAPHPPPHGALNRAAEGAGPAPVTGDGKIQQETAKTEDSDASSLCAEVKGESSRPVPAPRRMLKPSAAAAPASEASETRASQETNCPHAAVNSPSQNECSPNSSHISPASGRPKVNINHPWLTLIHPGPWTQLPRAPPPLPRSVYSMQNAWYRPKRPPQNPFREEEEDEEEERQRKPDPAGEAREAREAGGAVAAEAAAAAATSTAEASRQPARDARHAGTSEGGEAGNGGGSLAAAGPHDLSDGVQGHVLSRSLSVPAITSAHDQSSFLLHDMTEANESDQVRSCQSKVACKENPFDRKPAMVKSKSFQTLTSKQASAPGHGFPLIKRKVQTEQDLSTEGLQTEMSELDKDLEALEQRGVQLERNLRNSQNDKEEEQMLMEWFSLVYNRHVLMRKAIELVYLAKQQKLEERQADVEYELRCVFNKPDGEWSQEDREQEQQMMDELVAIIDQRNQIISSLDQDRLREREERMFFEAMNKDKEFQKEGLKELKKSKAKFNPTTVFKMLNHKARSTKDSTEKNN